MAKQAVSPVERHLEKGVLAVAVIVLIAVVVRYLISSPNTIDLGGRTVAPTEVYQSMVAEADDLRDRVRRAKIEIVEPENPTEEIRSLLTSASDTRLALVVPFGAAVPDLVSKKAEQGNIELVNVLKLGTPVVKVGRSGLELRPPEPVTEVPDEVKVDAIDPSYVKPVNWVTVAATFDVDAQRQLAESKRYLPGQAVPYLAGAELQRREKQWDGSYTDWKTVQTYAPYVLPELPFIEVAEENGSPVVPEEMAKKADAFREVIASGWLRVQLMRPLAPQAKYGDDWAPITIEGVDLAQIDDEVINEDEPACPFFDRYPKKKEKVKLWNDSTLAEKKELIQSLLNEIEDLIKKGCYEAAEAQAGTYVKGQAAKQFHEVGLLKELEDIYDQAKGLLTRKQQEELRRGNTPPPPREYSPTQVVWVHDAQDGSVIGGKTYQYRMRPLLFNNFLGHPGQLKNPKDAEIVLLPGEWSDPSDEVTIPVDTEFFVIRAKDSDKTARVEIFKWHEGEWLKAQFDVKEGSPIAGRENVPVNGTRTRMDFDTGARVIDLRFDYPYRERRDKRGGAWDFAEPKPTLSMVYVNAAGEVHQRILEEDKRDARYKELKDQFAAGATPPKP